MIFRKLYYLCRAIQALNECSLLEKGTKVLLCLNHV